MNKIEPNINPCGTPKNNTVLLIYSQITSDPICVDFVTLFNDEDFVVDTTESFGSKAQSKFINLFIFSLILCVM